MNNRRTKIAVDLLMTIFLVLSFVRWEAGNFAFHAVVGTACALLFCAHILIHRKWLKATTASCFAGKLSNALRWKYFVDILLLVLWGVSIVTGFVAVVPFLDGVAGSLWGRLHGVTARVGLALIVIHAVQHLPQIKSYIGLSKAVAKEGGTSQ